MVSFNKFICDPIRITLADSTKLNFMTSIGSYLIWSRQTVFNYLASINGGRGQGRTGRR